MCDGEEVAVIMTDKRKEITADAAHGLVGYINDCNRRTIAQYLGFKIVQKAMALCQACAEAKAKQMSLPTQTETVSVAMRPKN